MEYQVGEEVLAYHMDVDCELWVWVRWMFQGGDRSATWRGVRDNTNLNPHLDALVQALIDEC